MNFKKNHSDGAWIFVSHSHLDLVEVREVRNELEKLGHNPLLFYLKSMEDDSEQLPDLIKKEIHARNWFVLCESENSKKSDWVKKEVEIIKSLSGKVYETIYLEKDLDPQMQRLKTLSKRATIFLSYARVDESIASEISKRLKMEDYRVFEPNLDISAGSDWREEIYSNLDQAIQDGFVFILLSPASLSSEYVKEEVRYALLQGMGSGRGNIIPIIIKNRRTVYANLHAISDLYSIQMDDFTEGDFDENLTNLITVLKSREME